MYIMVNVVAFQITETPVIVSNAPETIDAVADTKG